MSAALLLAAVCGTFAAAQDAPTEAALIDVLKSNAGWLEKQDACRALRQIGTAASVPALAALLPDKDLSNLARYALEPMPFPEAGQALRDALATTEGLPRIGVVTSLGARRDVAAVPLLVPLLKDADLDMVRAAAGALGRIAAPEAVEALLACREAAPETALPAVAEGLLAAAQYAVEDGRRDEAASIYDELQTPRWPMHARMGAFRGRAYARPEQTLAFVLAAMLGDEPVFRGIAAQLIAEMPDEKATAFFAEALTKTSSGNAQIALLRGLANRKDPAARPEVAAAVQSPNPGVGHAAVKALGLIGNAADVPMLKDLLSSGDLEIADAARASLTIMPGEEVSLTLAAEADGNSTSRALLLDILTERRAGNAVPVAITSLGDTQADVRIAALGLLGALGSADQLPTVFAALAGAQDPSERSAAEKALTAISSRGGEETLPLLLDAMKDAAVESRMALLRVLAGLDGPKSLEAVLAGVQDADPQMSAEAVRLLADWPTPDAAPGLLALAQGEDLTRKISGLRGYVRLARMNPSAEECAGMLGQAMALATRPEEKMIVLSAWGALPAVTSLDALLPHLDDASVQNEAAVAVIAVVSELGKKDPGSKPRAIEALNAVIAKCGDPDIRSRAEAALKGLQ
jgi:HEAT repeat protein